MTETSVTKQEEEDPSQVQDGENETYQMPEDEDDSYDPRNGSKLSVKD
jgi:hypothetical protein